MTNYQYDEFGNLRRVDLADARVVSYHIDALRADGKLHKILEAAK